MQLTTIWFNIDGDYINKIMSKRDSLVYASQQMDLRQKPKVSQLIHEGNGPRVFAMKPWEVKKTRIQQFASASQ